MRKWNLELQIIRLMNEKEKNDIKCWPKNYYNVLLKSKVTV